MLKERARILAVGVFFLDLSLVSAAFLGAFWARNSVFTRFAAETFPSRLHPLSGYLPLLPVALVIWGTLLLLSGRYNSHRTVPLVTEAWAVLRVCVTGSILFTLFLYGVRLDELFLGHDRVSRSWVLLFSILACLLLLTEKLSLRLTSRYVRSHGLNYRTVMIVGTNATALTIAESIDSHRFWGYRILGFIRTEDGLEDEQVAEESRHAVLGDMDEIWKVLEGNVVDDVIFAIHRRDLDRLEELFLALQEQGIRIRFAIDLFPHARAQVQIEELDGMPLFSFATVPTSPLKLMFKRGLDVAMAALLLFLALPLTGLIALLIKLTSGGTVFFRQTRCGLNGRFFTLYKFRTMVEGAEDRRNELIHLNEMSGPVFKMKADPRITAFGRFLRRFSLDEVPQFWNVLRGDMSLVGPRPPIPEEVAHYKRWQRRRMAMKPGITCLWQVSGRNELDFDRWMELDLEYIDSWSPLLDLKILMRTIPAVLSGRGAS